MAGLFLFYFAATLALGAIAMRALDGLREAASDRARMMPRAIALAALAVVGAFSLAIAHRPSSRGSARDAFVIAVVVIVAARSGVDAISPRRSAWSLLAIAAAHPPVRLDRQALADGPTAWSTATCPTTVQRDGVIALCIAALVSPYCFAPRPFARACRGPLPVVVAMAVAAVGAVAGRARRTARR